MKVTVSTQGIDAARAHLRGLGKQVAFAASQALNQTARDIAAAMPAEIEQAIDRPVEFTKRGVGILGPGARRDNLQVTVGFKRAQAAYMKWAIEGGTYNPGAKGLRLPAAIKLNEYGNIPKGIIGQLIAVARKEQGLKKATSRRVKVSSKVDLFYGDPTDNGKPRPRGIYKVANGALIPLIIFPQRSATYRARFDFGGKAAAIAQRNWPRNFDTALQNALRTAR